MIVFTYKCNACGHTARSDSLALCTFGCPVCVNGTLEPHAFGKKIEFKVEQVLLKYGRPPRTDADAILEDRMDAVPYRYYRIPKIDRIPQDREARQFGAWYEEKDPDGMVELYMVCHLCGSVNKISTNEISPEGISQCFRCVRCWFTERVILEGWQDHRSPPVVFDKVDHHHL